MAKFMAYKRSAQQVVAVNTIDPQLEDLGNTLALADTSSNFPNKCENLVAVFRGDPYMLYRSAANEIRLSMFDISTTTWADVAGFTPITTGTGNLTPTCLQVVQDRLCAICERSVSIGSDGVIARRSAQDDGATWSPIVAKVFGTQPLPSQGSANIAWHNAVWIASSDGIIYYDPAADAFGATFDQGGGSITGQKANFGSFAIWGGALYYALATDSPTGSPLLFKLVSSWSVGTPTPTFTDTGLVFTSIGGIIVNNDSGNYSLFVSKLDDLCLLYSGSIQTKLVKITVSGTSLTTSDITNTVLPPSIQVEPNLGFGLAVDDRRSTNELQTIIVRFRPSVPVAVLLLSWDGSSLMEIVATLDDGGAGLDLIAPEDGRGDFRLYTANEPSCFIDATSAPFAGRTRIDYTIQDELSRLMDVEPQYSLDGQTWSNMTHGEGDSGIEGLASNASYFFNWDAWQDLAGAHLHVDVRVVARISEIP